MCTIPLDTAKVRLQLQRKTPSLPAPLASAAISGGMLATILCIAREEGVAALWKGIIPGLHRQFLYGGLRIGLYEPVCTSPHSCPSLLFQFKGTSHNSKAKLPSLPLQVKAFFVGGTAVTDVSLLSKILAALTTGWYSSSTLTSSILFRMQHGHLPLTCCTALAQLL